MNQETQITPVAENTRGVISIKSMFKSPFLLIIGIYIISAPFQWIYNEIQSIPTFKQVFALCLNNFNSTVAKMLLFSCITELLLNIAIFVLSIISLYMFVKGSKRFVGFFSLYLIVHLVLIILDNTVVVHFFASLYNFDTPPINIRSIMSPLVKCVLFIPYLYYFKSKNSISTF